MKKNYISPEVEILKTQPASMMAISLTDPAGTDLFDDMPVDNPEFIQVKAGNFDDFDW